MRFDNYVSRLGAIGISAACLIFATGAIAEATETCRSQCKRERTRTRAQAQARAQARVTTHGVRCFRIKVIAFRNYPGFTYRVHGCAPTPNAAPSAGRSASQRILALPSWLHVSRVHRVNGKRCITVFGNRQTDGPRDECSCLPQQQARKLSARSA
jgi:hypothetical protein